MTYIPAFVIAYSDSSFTNPHEVARPDDPPDCTGNFTHMGAKYWGFETARHRATRVSDNGQSYEFNHDAYHWLHLGLKSPARINRICISTRWFTGNQVPEVSVELISGHQTREVLSRVQLAPDQEHQFDIPPTDAGECIVRCYHEGGIARVSLYGDAIPAPQPPVNLLETATISHVSNEHYGKPADAVRGHRQVDYMLGWESARSGFGEHALFKLARPAAISSIVVDTYLHRLNPPLACHIFGISTEDADEAMALCPRYQIEFEDGLKIVPDDFQAYMAQARYLDEPATDVKQFEVHVYNPAPDKWHPLVSFGQLRADTWHHFREMEYQAPVSHIFYMHYPNGGIHSLHVYGES